MTARPGHAPSIVRAVAAGVAQGVKEVVISVWPNGAMGTVPVPEHRASLHGWEAWCAIVEEMDPPRQPAPSFVAEMMSLTVRRPRPAARPLASPRPVRE